MAAALLTTVYGCASRNGREAHSASGPTGALPLRNCTAGTTSKAEAIGAASSSATVALAKIAGRRVALVADEDAKAIVTVDLDTRTELATTSVGGTPGQVYVARDGRVFVSVRDKNALVALTAVRADAPLVAACGATTAAEPIAIAATPNGAKLVVTSAWGERVSVFDAATLARDYEVAVPREPRAVVVSDDGKTAFVSHAVGATLSQIDLAGANHAAKQVSLKIETEQSRVAKKSMAQIEKLPPAEKSRLSPFFRHQVDGLTTCQGFTLAKSTAIGGRIFAPQVAVDPGEPSSRPDGYGNHQMSTEVPSVAVVDESTGGLLPASVEVIENNRGLRLSSDARDEKPECLLPRAAAVDPATKSLLVTCFGIDAVIAYDATAASPLQAEKRRWTVGSGPSGVAVDVEKGRAVVWSQFDRTLSTFALSNELSQDKDSAGVQTAHLAALPTALPADYALGRILFHAAGDRRISRDGRACASCHPDGRDDAITWATPEGPRRSIMLAGRVTESAPYAWNGVEKTLPGHLGNTFDRLSGTGLRSVELDALVAYLTKMPAPPAASADAAKVARGHAIFDSAEAGCATCHSGAPLTDGKNHDVGSKSTADRAATFNTPSLHLVGGTGPYFHDGRYATLSELLVKSDGKMGHTKHLTNADLEALETYLRTL